MKNLLLLICILPTVLMGQITKDSVAIVERCNCERSVAKYKDKRDRKYHVFLDKTTDEIFIIERKRRYYRRTVISTLK